MATWRTVVWAGLFGASTGITACGGTGEGDNASAQTECAVEPPIWYVDFAPTDETLLGVWGRRSDDVFAVGWNGTILHYDGETWTPETIRSDRTLSTRTATTPLTGVAGVPLPADFDPMDPTFVPGPVWACGYDGTILVRGEDGTWDDAPRSDIATVDEDGMPIPATATTAIDFFDITVHDEDQALIVGDTGTLVVWDGFEWRPRALRFESPFPPAPGEPPSIIEPRGTLHGTYTPNGNDYFAVGSAGAAYRSSGGPYAWELIDTTVPNPVRSAWGPNPNNVFAVGLDSLILRFRGGNWTVIRNQGADELPVEFLQDVHGRGGPELLVVGWRGFVAHFRDGWEAEEVPTDRDLRSVWMAEDADVSFIVGAEGTILRRDLRPLQAWQERCLMPDMPMMPMP